MIDLFSCDGIQYFAWDDPNQTCQLALVFASEEGAGTEQRSLRSLMDGGVLKHQNNEKRLVFELIVSAVKELHDADIAHGDLKPENLIIFFHKGCLECKVIDLDRTVPSSLSTRKVYSFFVGAVRNFLTFICTSYDDKWTPCFPMQLYGILTFVIFLQGD